MNKYGPEPIGSFYLVELGVFLYLCDEAFHILGPAAFTDEALIVTRTISAFDQVYVYRVTDKMVAA